MGSLMAGWDSPVQDPKYVAYQRNKSFTKEEIEAYWRSKKKAEGELHKATSSPTDGGQDRYAYEGTAGTKVYRRSNSLPTSTTDAKEGSSFVEMDWEKLIKNKGWWTRSNWAFLNEPPVFEGTTNRYAAQFHVANLRRSELNGGAGSSP